MNISEATRRDLVDSLILDSTDWAGRLEEPDFLARIFDLRAMPSRDHRFRDAYGDIWQHRVNNPQDWEEDWVFHDARFDLLHCDDELFLRFLCETLHPVVRSDPEEIEKLRQNYNHFLRADGYEVVERTQMAGRPVFVARQIQIETTAPASSLKERFPEGTTSYVARQITRMESAIYGALDLAIGTAKELVESVCKTILSERGISDADSLDLPALVKRTAKELNLAPEDVSEAAKAAKTIKRVLSNLASITSGVAELRNNYGTGHGQKAEAQTLSPRHAKLAVGAASTLAVFLLETHQERSDA